MSESTRIVRCCHCRGMMRVPARAISVFCPHCQRRAPLESMRILAAHPGKMLATCGDIFVERTAKLNLSVIADNVVIHGRVRGPVVANQTVEVGSTGQVYGDIRAAKIVVHDGAVIEGRCEMVLPPPAPQAAPEQPAVSADGHSAPSSETEAPQVESQPRIARPSPLAPPPMRLPQRTLN